MLYCLASYILDRLSLLLAACASFLFPFARNDLAQHDHTVAIHEGDTRQAFAILEGVAHEGLLRLEGALGHLVRLQGVRFFHFLSTSFFAHLPCQLRDAASRAAATHETDGRVADLNLVGDVQNLNLSRKLLRLTEGRVFLVHHYVTRTWHVVLIQTFDVKADIVPRVRKVGAR